MTTEERLKKFERRYRRLLEGMLAVVAAGVCVVAMGMSSGVPDAVRARRFVMVDENGKPVWRAP